MPVKTRLKTRASRKRSLQFTIKESQLSLSHSLPMHMEGLVLFPLATQTITGLRQVSTEPIPARCF
jgi:hypothetical protein